VGVPAALLILSSGDELHIVVSDNEDADLDGTAAHDAILDVGLTPASGLVDLEGQRFATVGTLGVDGHRCEYYT
jgi:hypothetical protein